MCRPGQDTYAFTLVEAPGDALYATSDLDCETSTIAVAVTNDGVLATTSRVTIGTESSTVSLGAGESSVVTAAVAVSEESQPSPSPSAGRCGIRSRRRPGCTHDHDVSDATRTITPGGEPCADVGVVVEPDCPTSSARITIERDVGQLSCASETGVAGPVAASLVALTVLASAVGAWKWTAVAASVL